MQHIVATTRPMSNSSTSNKSQGQISSGEYELCNSQENSIGNHNSILLTIYLFMVCAMTVYPTLISIPCPHVLLLIHLMSTSRPAYCIHVLWHYTLNPTLNLCHPCMYHIYIMRNYVSWYYSISRLFLILLDYSRPYDVMLYDFLVTCLLSLVID